MIIDNLYESVVKELTTQGKIKDISNKLLSLKSNNERVLYVYELLSELNYFPELKEVNKSDTVSAHYRNLGNKCFQSCSYVKAWQYYNLALLHAPLKSESYCLALSNRSIVFIHMEKYEECLKDIGKILSLNFPEQLKDKLKIRQKLCQEALCKKTVKNKEIPDLDNLSMKSSKHDRYLSASSKLEVVFTKVMGRHLIAKENISVGEILVEEDPYFVLLLQAQYLFSCAYCLSRDLNLLPCEYCCYTFYCSDECKKKALDEYHSVECKLMATLLYMKFTKLELLALRTVLKARNEQNDWEIFFKIIDEAEANMNNEYRGHVQIDGKWVFDSKHYASIHTLETNVDKRHISDIFQKAVTAATFLNLLIVGSTFLQVKDEILIEKVKSCTAGLLLLHLMTTPVNMHGIGFNIETNGIYVEEVDIASAPYAFHSLLNHSCAPNVVRVNRLGSGRMSLVALRPIKEGMPILDNYGAHHALENREARRTSLKNQYKFNCFCEACLNNWPTYLEMKPSLDIPSNLLKMKNKLAGMNVITDLEKGDLVTARKVFKSLCSLCTHFEQYAPCKELSECQESLKRCLDIFAGLLPGSNKIMIPWTTLPPVL